MKTAAIIAAVIAALFPAFTAASCAAIYWARNPQPRKKRRNRK